MSWFYIDANGHKRGPYTESMIKKLVGRGTITSSTTLLDENGNKTACDIITPDDRNYSHSNESVSGAEDTYNDTPMNFDYNEDNCYDPDPFDNSDFSFEDDNPFTDSELDFESEYDPVPVPYTQSYDEMDYDSKSQKGSGWSWSEFFTNLLVGIGLAMLFDAILDAIFGRRRY